MSTSFTVRAHLADAHDSVCCDPSGPVKQTRLDDGDPRIHYLPNPTSWGTNSNQMFSNGTVQYASDTAFFRWVIVDIPSQFQLGNR